MEYLSLGYSENVLAMSSNTWTNLLENVHLESRNGTLIIKTYVIFVIFIGQFWYRLLLKKLQFRLKFMQTQLTCSESYS